MWLWIYRSRLWQRPEATWPHAHAHARVLTSKKLAWPRNASDWLRSNCWFALSWGARLKISDRNNFVVVIACCLNETRRPLAKLYNISLSIKVTFICARNLWCRGKFNKYRRSSVTSLWRFIRHIDVLARLSPNSTAINCFFVDLVRNALPVDIRPRTEAYGDTR